MPSEAIGSRQPVNTQWGRSVRKAEGRLRHAGMRAVIPRLTLQELTDAVFGEYLAEHLSLDLAWLQQCYDSNAAADRGLSLQRVTEFFEWNQEVCGCLLMPRAGLGLGLG